MVYRKKTLRKTPETTRKLAKLTNELESILRRMRNLMPEIASLEHDSIALYRIQNISAGPAKTIKCKPEPSADLSLFPTETPEQGQPAQGEQQT